MRQFFRTLIVNNKFQIAKYKKNVFQQPKRGTKEQKVFSERVGFNLKARDQVRKMQKNLVTNTPKIGAGILLAFSVPQFYYMYQAINKDYTDSQFLVNLRKSLDYMNYKNAFFAASFFGLQAVNFLDQRAKNAVAKKGTVYLFCMIPIVVGLCSQSFLLQNNIDKKVVFPSMMSDVSLLMLEAKLANEAFLPFWMFNLKYQVHLFDIFYLTCVYFAFKNLNKDIQANPNRYLHV